MMGYVYVLSNDSYKDEVLKIGRTEKNPEDRARELSKDTGVPLPFNVKHYFQTSKHVELENYIHKKLEKQRLNGGREFFKTTLKEISDIVKEFEVNVSKTKKTSFERKELKNLVKIFVHNTEIFPTRQDIIDFFINKIKLNDETYHLNKNYKVREGTIVWIKYDTEIIGEFKVKRGVEKVERIGFENQILIDLNSLRIYAHPISYYDFISFENVGRNHQAYHDVSYEVYFELTKFLFGENDFIHSRINRDTNLNNVRINHDEGITYFLPKSLDEKIQYKMRNNEKFLSLYNDDENVKNDICFSICELNNELILFLKAHNVSLNSESEINSLFENIRDNDYRKEEEVIVVKQIKICDINNCSMDEVIQSIDSSIDEIKRIVDEI